MAKHLTTYELNVHDGGYRFHCACGAMTIGTLEQCREYDAKHENAWVKIDPKTGKPLEKAA